MHNIVSLLEDLCSILNPASFPLSQAVSRARNQAEQRQSLPGAQEGIQRVYGAGQKHGRKPGWPGRGKRTQPGMQEAAHKCLLIYI